MPSLRSVVVMQTWFLADGVYQIELGPDLEARARTVLLTRDPELYTIARVAEGYPIHFDATWRMAKRPDGRRCQVLETFVLAGAGASHELDERTGPQ